jgi:serine/threonine protein kinase
LHTHCLSPSPTPTPPKNSHIPRFYGLGCFDHASLAAVRSSLFSVEEFVGTRSLRRLLAEQMLSPTPLYDMRWALRWAVQVADALAALHGRSPQYIHGDVTSDNVFLEDHRHLEEAAVKLGDLKPHR